MKNLMNDGLVSTNNNLRISIDLRVAIDRYEKEVVDPIISEINFSFTTQVICHIFLIILGIFINLNPSPTKIIGTLAIGLMVIANWPTAREAFERFQKERRILLDSVMIINTTLDLCYEDDEAGLEEVEALLRSYLEALSS